MPVSGTLANKTIVITGATSGIGEVAALRLAEQGARIVMIARDAGRAEAALGPIRKANPAADHNAHIADLSRIDEVRRVARQLRETEPVIDVLANNAGAIFSARQETPDGLEMTFAVNHMAYFLLTDLLLDHVKAARGRIVNTASDAHYNAALDFDDLQAARGYSGWTVYCRSKLMNILFTRELARRIAGSGVTVNAFHPGFVKTRFGDNGGGLVKMGLSFAKTMVAISPEEGARTLVYLASSPDVANVSGRYFHKAREKEPSAQAGNDADAARLWQVSEAIASTH